MTPCLIKISGPSIIMPFSDCFHARNQHLYYNYIFSVSHDCDKQGSYINSLQLSEPCREKDNSDYGHSTIVCQNCRNYDTIMINIDTIMNYD